MTERFPPRPHDPRDRVRVAEATGWEARQFAIEDARLAYFAPRGFLHLQLWHPARGVSVLTPSRITGGRHEVWAVDGDRLAVTGWRGVAGLLPDLPLPGRAELAALEHWFVLRHEPGQVRLLRQWWAAPTARRGA